MKYLVAFVIACLFLPMNLNANEYTIDTSHSHVGFKIKHQKVSYTHGRFNEFQGKFNFDAKDDSKNSLSLKIKSSSIDTNHEKRDKHLRNQDFFFVKKYKTLSFTSTSFKKKEGTDNKYSITGVLKIHGKKKEITVDATFIGEGKNPYGGYLCGFECNFTINRSDFGMKYMVGPIADKVHISIALEGSRK